MATPKKKKTVRKTAVEAPIANATSVSIDKADNGYTVSAYTDNGHKRMVAKSHSEALRHVKSLFGEGGGK